MATIKLSSHNANTFKQSFRRINQYGQLLKFFKSSPFSLVYGPTSSGKTYALKQIFKESSGSIFYMRTSPTTWRPKDNPKIRVTNRKANLATFRDINTFLNKRSEVISLKGDENTLSWMTFVFDDMLNLQGDLRLEYNKILTLLAFNGRHYRIRTIVLAQSYVKVDKSVRSQASSFLCLLPISDTYRQQIYQDYWKIFKNERDLIELEELPKHSFLFKFQNKKRFVKIV